MDGRCSVYPARTRTCRIYPPVSYTHLTAEIIKCIDKNISRLPNECALLDSLYGDETTTSDNIASMVKVSQSSKPVTLAVANLYLRQQIIFERV